MVIRDLTLRSAASFGSFHLIRLLYDEYLFYLIEQKIATHTQKTPIAVMAEVRRPSLLILRVQFDPFVSVDPAEQIVGLRRCQSEQWPRLDHFH